MRISRKRYVCILGLTATDCGPAALATVARHYGKHVKLSTLRDMLETTSHGTTITDIVKGAHSLGFVASCGKAKPGVLRMIPLPAIAHHSDASLGHYVVIHAVREKHIIIADPTEGLKKIPWAEFDRRWSGFLVLLQPSNEFVKAHTSSQGLTSFTSILTTNKRYSS